MKIDYLFLIVSQITNIVFSGYPISYPNDLTRTRIPPYNLIDTDPSCWYEGVCPMFPPGGELSIFPNHEEKWQHILHNIHRMFTNCSLTLPACKYKCGGNPGCGNTTYCSNGCDYCGDVKSNERGPMYWYSDANQAARFKQWDEKNCDSAWYKSQPGVIDRHYTCKWGNTNMAYWGSGITSNVPQDRCGLLMSVNAPHAECEYGTRASKFCHDDKDRCWFESEGICGGNYCLWDPHCEPVFAAKIDYVGKGFIAGMNGVDAVYSRFTKEVYYPLPIASHFEERIVLAPGHWNSNGKYFNLMLEYHDGNKTQTPIRCHAFYSNDYHILDIYVAPSMDTKCKRPGQYNNQNVPYYSAIFYKQFIPHITCEPYAFICKTSKNKFFRLPEEREYFFGTDWFDWAWSDYQGDFGYAECKEQHYYNHPQQSWTANGGPTLTKQDLWYYQRYNNGAGNCIGCTKIPILECLENCVLNDDLTSQCKTACSGSPTTPTTAAPTPTKLPTKSPTTKTPTKSPIKTPTRNPIKTPTRNPIKSPTKSPIKSPTKLPTKSPTKNPTTKTPTQNPNKQPTTTKTPTKSPIKTPTRNPIKTPTRNPIKSPTKSPIKSPTKLPTKSPTKNPTTKTPTQNPNKQPTTTKTPTKSPIKSPTKTPTKTPTTKTPTQNPIQNPTISPIINPTESPTETPVQSPSINPTLSSETPTFTPSITSINPTIITLTPTRISGSPTDAPIPGDVTCEDIIDWQYRWSRVSSWNEESSGPLYKSVAEEKFIENFPHCGEFNAEDGFEYYYYFYWGGTTRPNRKKLFIYMHVCCGIGRTFGPQYHMPQGFEHANDYRASAAWNRRYNGAGYETEDEWTNPGSFGIKQYIVFAICILLIIVCIGACIFGWKRYKKKRYIIEGANTSTSPRGMQRYPNKSRGSKKNLAQTIQMHGLSSYPGPKHVQLPSYARDSTDGSTDGNNTYQSRFMHNDSTDGSNQGDGGNVSKKSKKSKKKLVPPMFNKMGMHQKMPSRSVDIDTPELGAVVGNIDMDEMNLENDGGNTGDVGLPPPVPESLIDKKVNALDTQDIADAFDADI
eukprot:275921_1